MANKQTHSPLGPNGEPLLVEERKTTVTSVASSEDLPSGSKPQTGTEVPVCPLIGWNGTGDKRYVSLKIYKGTAVSGGSHIMTVRGLDISRVDEDYLRSSFSEQYGYGAYTIQGVNARGLPVGDTAYTANITGPKIPGMNNGNESVGGSFHQFMQAQLENMRSQSVAAERRAETQAQLNNTMMLAMLNKPPDTTMSTILAAVLPAVVTALTSNKGSSIDPTVNILLENAKIAAAESTRRAEEATRAQNDTMNKLVETLTKEKDPGGMAQIAANTSSALVTAAANIAQVAASAGNKASFADPNTIRALGELGNNLGVRDFLSGASRNYYVNPQTTTKQANVTVNTPPPVPHNGNGNSNGNANADGHRPLNAGIESTTSQPNGSTQPNITSHRVATSRGGKVDWKQAVAELDEYLKDQSKTPQDVANLFVHHLQVTKAIPGLIFGPLVENKDNSPMLNMYWEKFGVAHWANEPFASKIKDALGMISLNKS